MHKIFTAIIVLILVLPVVSKAQDPQFSQFYAAPLYLNPAFSGSTGLARAGLNYRKQWPSMNASFTTYSAFFDYFFDEVNSGVGILFMSDREGLAGLNTHSVALQYTYEFRISESLVIRPALEGSYTISNLDFGNLVFGDQINYQGIYKPVTDEMFNSDFRNNYFDVGTGVLVYSKNLWIGFSAHHLLKPNLSFLDNNSQLPLKYSVHAGYKILMPTTRNLTYSRGYRDVSLTPTVQYKQQGQFSQLDVGLYFTYEPIVLGASYRGVPFKTVDGFANNESVIALVGISTNGLSIGYSYDYTISNLGIRTGGAHEMSIRYEFFLGDPRKPPKNVRELPCPRF